MKFIRSHLVPIGWGRYCTERRRLGAGPRRCVLTTSVLYHGTQRQRRDDAGLGLSGLVRRRALPRTDNSAIPAGRLDVTDSPRRQRRRSSRSSRGADHVRALVPFTTTRPGERASRRAFGRHLRQLPEGATRQPAERRLL